METKDCCEGRVSVCVRVCMCVVCVVSVFVCVCTLVCMCTYVYMYVCGYDYVCIHTCVSTSVHVCIHCHIPYMLLSVHQPCFVVEICLQCCTQPSDRAPQKTDVGIRAG